MKCPYCREDHDRVLDTRGAEDGYSIRRRRLCLACNRRYTTYERAAEFDLKVVKKDGVREPFQPEKIRAGLQRACWKRPISDEQILSLVTEIEQEVFANFDIEIDSQELGEIVMKFLSTLDQVAYVRFASVYREFKDASDFVDVLHRASATASPPNSGPDHF